MRRPIPTVFLAGLLLGSGEKAAIGQAAKPPVPARSAAELLAEADLHYARRHEGHTGDRADGKEIEEAIAAYESAANEPESAEARWKLARALYFQGAYAGLTAESRRTAFEKACRVSEEAIAILGRRARGAAGFSGLTPARVGDAARRDPDAAPTFFWAAVSWGEWALTVGKLAAVKTGAATRIRDDALTVIALDPAFEEGGGYRILGRLHDQAPRVPLVTWWVSRREALDNLRRALAAGPKNLVNLHFLAQALSRGDAAERAEAIGLEKRVVEAEPAAARLVEEAHIQAEARQDLAKWEKG